MKNNTNKARHLRINQTDAETKLWFHLRARRLEGFKFRRQVPVDRFIADFICADVNLIIELDGGQHAEQQDYDAERTKVLNNCGYKVLRYWNNEVLENMDGVLEDIRSVLLEGR
jgi:very-short-patch-repair endonuclease